MIKLIASDLDGTILSHDFRISARTVEAFGKAREAGIEVVFVTGRPPRSLGPLREFMGQAGHRIGRVICSNGAVVYDLEACEVIDVEDISHEDLLATVKTIRSRVPGVLFAAETLRGFIAEEGFSENGPSPSPRPGSQELPELLEPSEGALKLLVMDPSHRDADRLLEAVRAVVGPEIHATHSAPHMALLELSRGGVTKASTLARYAAELGITAEEVMAFGDMPNDLQMLSWAGASYAMASGHPLAQQAARYTAPAFGEDGVACVIEELLEQGRTPEGVPA